MITMELCCVRDGSVSPAAILAVAVDCACVARDTRRREGKGRERKGREGRERGEEGRSTLPNKDSGYTALLATARLSCLSSVIGV